ncbi:PREDICTED: uncharacterized protein LOC107173167 [Diuraphis noxia]|uniref:uncharacterized protein LOC107173167 n=1 Tax=Diuraphis noxia TaxID=143948 RepID=UPI0007639EEB|nr:PREDICTED: uncharacterized protein LOC107173167 [Diuraphis noxia]
MCDRLAALDGLVPPAVVACRSTPSSPNAYRAVIQLQQLEKTASVPDLQQKRHHHGDGPEADHQAAPASACPDSKSDGCLTDSGRAPVTSLSGTFLTPLCKTDNKTLDGQKHQLNQLNNMTMATDCTRDMHQDGLILPRKPTNPCLTSADHQNLHRELLFNQKIGKNVLGQKSELQKALEKHKRTQNQKEIEQQKNSCRTPFERMIEERAKKIETQMEKSDAKEKDEDKPEFLQVHAKLRAKMAKTD